MAIRKYTKNDFGKRVGANLTVFDMWLNPKITDCILVDDALVEALDRFSEKFGAPVSFGSPNALYRTAATNAACGGAGNSLHVKGRAADFSIEGVAPLELARYAEVLGLGGIGMYRGVKYIHMDTREGKARWWILTSNSNTPGFGGVPVSFKIGHRSPAVADIQRALSSAGFPCGSIDGSFGKLTRDALMKFQCFAGLSIDGVFGKATNKALGVFKW